MDDASLYERGGVHWDTAPRRYYALSGFYARTREDGSRIPYHLDYSAHDDEEALEEARKLVSSGTDRYVVDERVVERFLRSKKTRDLPLPW